jgi:hypothetical protein
MRWSTYRGADGVERAAVWRDNRLYPAPDGTGLVDLLATTAPGCAPRPRPPSTGRASTRRT